MSLFQAANEGDAEGGNVVISPAALNFALATVCSAADGTTRDQLRELLRHGLLGSDHNDRKIHALYKPFATLLQQIEPSAGIHMATALWLDPNALKSPGDNLDAFGRHMAEIFGT